jgi:Ran GTPase-activating protein (RanGAP) involved in mRNA processing and transport
MGIHDEQIRLLAGYLKTNPNLRSVVLDDNPFTDDGLNKLTEELKTNQKLAHLSIRDCPNITDDGLRKLCEVICTVNTVLFQIDLDPLSFDTELAKMCVTESALNRDIQEKLKPRKILSELNFDDNTINSSSGIQTAEDKARESKKQALIA